MSPKISAVCSRHCFDTGEREIETEERKPKSKERGRKWTALLCVDHRSLAPTIFMSLIARSPVLPFVAEAIEKTPGLREILWDIVEKPSVWSIVRRGEAASQGGEHFLR